jgi:hypothetical protein
LVDRTKGHTDKTHLLKNRLDKLDLDGKRGPFSRGHVVR